MRVVKARPHSQAAKTSPSHGEGVGSIPAGVTKIKAGWSKTVLLYFVPRRSCKSTSNCKGFLFGEQRPTTEPSKRRATNAHCSLLPSSARRGSDSRWGHQNKSRMVKDHPAFILCPGGPANPLQTARFPFRGTETNDRTVQKTRNKRPLQFVAELCSAGFRFPLGSTK